jgi:hypothetical protein
MKPFQLWSMVFALRAIGALRARLGPTLWIKNVTHNIGAQLVPCHKLLVMLELINQILSSQTATTALQAMLALTRLPLLSIEILLVSSAH